MCVHLCLYACMHACFHFSGCTYVLAFLRKQRLSIHSERLMCVHVVYLFIVYLQLQVQLLL